VSDAPPSTARPSGVETSALEERCHEWYRDHGPAVYGYFRFHVPSVDVAEDLTAETFLKLVRSAVRYDPAKGSPRAWILAIARNVLRDWARRGRLRQYVALGNLHDLEWDAPSPEERLLREEEVGRLLDAVAGLAPGDRELIGLRYGSGLDGAEVAEILGVSEGMVRTRLWRALGRLRGVLQPPR
jgi:RNA polymerase sigma factor (sigma-70 family)